MDSSEERSGKIASVADFLEREQKVPNDVAACGEVLTLIREHRLRESNIVCRAGSRIMRSKFYRRSLGDAVWVIYEQILMAFLDCSQPDHEIARECISRLKEQFPQSRRVLRLSGMIAECRQDWTAAVEIYSQMTTEDPADDFPRKRLVAIHKAKADIPRAILELNEHLKDFPADTEAWSELVDLYLSIQEYKQAAFSCEELILVAPANWNFHLLYAEILCTIGGHENFRLARKYFSHAADLNFEGKGSQRALYGLMQATLAIASQSKDDVGNADLFRFAVDELKKRYQAEGGTTSKMAIKALDKTVAKNASLFPGGASSSSASSSSSEGLRSRK